MSKFVSRIVIGFTTALLVHSAQAGGFVEVEGAVFAADSNEIDNVWWPLPADTRFTYFAEDREERYSFCGVRLQLPQSKVRWDDTLFENRTQVENFFRTILRQCKTREENGKPTAKEKMVSIAGRFHAGFQSFDSKREGTTAAIYHIDCGNSACEREILGRSLLSFLPFLHSFIHVFCRPSA